MMPYILPGRGIMFMLPILHRGCSSNYSLRASDYIKNGRITTELCSFTQLDALKARGPYDAVFSNFGGLNCTPDLDKVLASFNSLLKPGGVATMVIIPEFCLWEALLVFKGKFRRQRAGRLIWRVCGLPVGIIIRRILSNA